MVGRVTTSGWSGDENFGKGIGLPTAAEEVLPNRIGFKSVGKEMSPGFHTRDSQGFQVTFENGFTVSVQFGFGNYCENKADRQVNGLVRMVDCKDAEVAVFYPNGGFVPISDGGSADDIAGWVSPDHVAVLMAIVAQLPANKKFTHEPLKFRAGRNDAN